METKTKTTEQKAKDQVILEKNNVDQLGNKKVNLIATLSQLNKSANVSRTIKDKYIYPIEYADMKSTEKEKKSYRKKIQKTILYYLKQNEITAQTKKEFENFLKTFVSNFESLNKAEISEIYSFHNEKEKEAAKKVLTNYQNVK